MAKHHLYPGEWLIKEYPKYILEDGALKKPLATIPEKDPVQTSNQTSASAPVWHKENFSVSQVQVKDVLEHAFSIMQSNVPNEPVQASPLWSFIPHKHPTITWTRQAAIRLVKKMRHEAASFGYAPSLTGAMLFQEASFGSLDIGFLPHVLPRKPASLVWYLRVLFGPYEELDTCVLPYIFEAEFANGGTPVRVTLLGTEADKEHMKLHAIEEIEVDKEHIING